MTTIRLALSALLLAALAVATSQAPAHAGVVVTVTVDEDTTTIYAACSSLEVSVFASTPGFTWEADVSLKGPDGSVVSEDYIYAGSSKAEFYLCPGLDPVPGQFEVDFDNAVWTDDNFNDHYFSIPDQDVNLHLAPSITTLKASDTNVSKGDIVKLTATVNDQRPNGSFFPTESQNVLIQRQKGNRWVKAGSGYTNSRGIAAFRHRFSEKITFRALVRPDEVGGSRSRPVTIR